MHSTYNYILCRRSIDFPELAIFASRPGAMNNLHWLELPMARTLFYGPKGVRTIEVRLYISGTIALPSLAVPVGDMIDEEPSPGTEIFNGQDAEPHAWPFMAHIIRRGSFVCGAALIARKWVITAGHCVA